MKRPLGKNHRHIWKGAEKPETKAYGVCCGCHMRRRVEWSKCPNCGSTAYDNVATCFVAYRLGE